MAVEKKFLRIGPLSFTSDGGANGLVTVASVECLKTKMKVKIEATGETTLVLQIKRILSPTTLLVGPIQQKHRGSNNLLARQDISAYTVAKAAMITAEEQDRQQAQNIAWEDIRRAVYEEEPTVALRTIGVDKLGVPWSKNNPLPVDASFSADIDIAFPITPHIQIVDAPTADTEYSVTLPDNNKGFLVKVRGAASTYRIGFAASDTDDGGDYMKICRGAVYQSPVLDLPDSSKVYMRADKAGVEFEVHSWTNP